MPNRHNSGAGRPSASRSPAGGRNLTGSRSPAVRSPAGSRTARTVPVSRAPGTPSYTEPEMRRWPHPLEDPAPAPAPEPAMHYIRCALSYQNQILADIKALLEELVSDRTSEAARAAEDANPEDRLDKM